MTSMQTPTATSYEIAHKVPTRQAVGQMMTKIPIEIVHLSSSVALLEHPCGNMLVSHGPDGVLAVDCYTVEMADLVDEAIRTFTAAPYRFAVPTHFHYDHAGGAAMFAAGGALVIGAPNARARMSCSHVVCHMGVQQEAYPDIALPTLNFESALTVKLNGETVSLQSFSAHTDTDAVVRFDEANVVHTGDVFVNMTDYPTYPFLDMAAGASSVGALDAVEFALGLCDDRTVVLPGHGPRAGISELRSYRDLLAAAHDGVKQRLDAGLSRAEIVASADAILADFRLNEPLVDDWIFIGDVVDSIEQSLSPPALP
nr:MBL fold metallo-hydrolase [Rhodococcus sp. (in: high G+C Gram-positive bacteria)]